MFEQIGLGGVLSFDESRGIKSMGRARDEFGRFARSSDDASAAGGRYVDASGRMRDATGRFVAGAQQGKGAADGLAASFARLAREGGSIGGIGEGLGKIGGGLRSAGIAALPLTGALALGAKRAADFEFEMSAVGAITNASAEDMVRLTDTANQMGAQSKFTATEAAQAMQYMGLAGAETEQIIAGIPGVMNAAAAESIDLATSADIVAQATNIMGREWSQASNTADVLTKAAQASNTDIINLGESLKYGGLVAHNLGMSLETTTGLLGKLADAGLRGSIGGTSLSHALEKLAKPTKKGAAWIEQLGLKMTMISDGKGGAALDFVDVVDQLSTKLKDVKNPLDRTMIATEIFGVQGARAFNALQEAGTTATRQLIDDLYKASEGEGAAAKAAKKRMDNFSGAVELFFGQLDAFAMKVFLPMMGPLKDMLMTAVGWFEEVMNGITLLNQAGGDSEKRFDAMFQLFAGGGDIMLSTALGIIDAIDQLKTMLTDTIKTVQGLGAEFGIYLGGDTIRDIVRIAIVFGVVAGAVAPLIGLLYGVYYVISAVLWPIIEGTFLVISNFLLSPLGAAVAALVLLFFVVRREGESVGDTLSRVWEGIKIAAESVWTTIQAVWSGMEASVLGGMSVLQAIWVETVGVIQQTISDVAEQWSMLTGEASVDWEEVGVIVGAVLMALAETVLRVFEFGVYAIGGVIRLVMTLVETILSFLIPVWAEVYLAISKVWEGLSLIFGGHLLAGLKTLAGAIFDFVLIPLKSILSQIIALADAVGGGGLIPDAVRSFALERAKIGGESKKDSGGAFDIIFGDGEVPAKVAADQDSRAMKEFDSLGKEVLAKRAAQKGAPTEVNVNVENPPAKLEVNSELNVDGSRLSLASERHRQEISERAGFHSTPWQRRARVEHGATPVNQGG